MHHCIPPGLTNLQEPLHCVQVPALADISVVLSDPEERAHTILSGDVTHQSLVDVPDTHG